MSAFSNRSGASNPSQLEGGGKPGLRRSHSAQSGLSKASTPTWARPILRRSVSVNSAFSKNTENSGFSKGTEQSSIPSGCHLGELKEESVMQVIYSQPWSASYDFKDKAGEGGFGQVWECTHKGTEQAYAIKRIATKEKKDMERTLRELKAFERLCNPYIVTLHEVFLDQEYLYLVMDLCTGGDLLKYMETYQDDPERVLRRMEFPDHVMGLPTRMVAYLLWQMLAGIAYMHHHRFCHRDIKLQNYVIKEPARHPRLQLVDFGMAVRYRKGVPLTGTMGTMKYMAPEVLQGPYSEKCDIWSIGVVCYILSTERSPWGGKKTSQQMSKCILENLRERWPACDKPTALKSLIDTMMCRDANFRPSAKHLLKSSKWLKKNSRPLLSPEPPACCVVS